MSENDPSKSTPDSEWWLNAPGETTTRLNPSVSSDVENRRRHDRLDLGLPAQIHEVTEVGQIGSGLTCEMVDASRSGMGVRCRRMIYPGRHVFVVVTMDANGKKVLGGVVRYSRYDSNGLYHVGIEFEKPPASAEVQAWLQSLHGD